MSHTFRYLVIAGCVLFSPPVLRANASVWMQYETCFSANDSLHSPKKAAILSALLPGAGQAYNKKYWKMPIVYAAGITGGYLIVTNYRDYVTYKEAYVFRTDTLSSTVDPFPKYSASQLKVFRETYHRNLELSVIVTTAVYLLQILDATVDAHLFEFDVTNNLALQVKPCVFSASRFNYAPAMGLSMVFSFHNQ